MTAHKRRRINDDDDHAKREARDRTVASHSRLEVEEGEVSRSRDDKDDDEGEYELELDQDDTEMILEASRKRRQAIMQKYSACNKVTPEPGTAKRSATNSAKEPIATSHAQDEAREQEKLGKKVAVPNTDTDASEGKEEEDEEYEEIEVEDDDDLDDMFALEDDEPNKKKKKVIRVAKGSSATIAPTLVGDVGSNTAALKDNWDDAEGYYRVMLGETLDEGRYQVFANLGKGMFASVVRARDVREKDKEVAIKIVRVQESMYKAGLKEMSMLKKLASLDPEDKKHVVRLERHFEHRGHLCMVFESLSMNLRQVVKRFGKDVGLNLRAVKAYAYQMFQALSLMRKAELMHADIKPDNILMNEAKTQLKICDLGSACHLSEMEITPYLVSRFYRAPEIILGQAYDWAIDVWSVGCTLYELGTGKILFPGRSNNEMLLLMQKLRGRFTTKQMRKGRFADQHFDATTNAFLSAEKDKSTGQDVVRRVVLQKPVEDMRARLLPGDAARRLGDDELRLTQAFVDLLNRCLELDPARRITPKEALAHPFMS